MFNQKVQFSEYSKMPQPVGSVLLLLRSLVNIRASTSIKLLNGNDNLVSDPKIISNVFNNYFSSIGPLIECKIPNVPGSFKDYFEKIDKNGKLLINPCFVFPLTYCSFRN